MRVYKLLKSAETENYTPQTLIRFKRTLSLIGNTRGKTILDIGCGPAPISGRLVNKADVIIGIDLLLEHLRLARGKGVECIVADLDKGLPLRSNSVDVVLATEVLEHIYDTGFLLSEVRRVLKPLGLLILSVPNICSLSSRMKVLIGELPSGVEYDVETINGKRRAGHIRAFNKQILIALLKKHKFEIEDIRTDVIIIPKFLSLPWRFKVMTNLGETIIVRARVVK